MVWRKLVLLFWLLVLVSFSHGTERYLIFNKGSRFFVRLNLKENLFNSTNTFIHGVGFKMSWDLPDKVHDHRRIQRRDLYQGIETLLNQHKINGQLCLRRFLCEAKVQLKENEDFTSRFMKLIFTPDVTDEKHVVSDIHCGEDLQECPISLLSFL